MTHILERALDELVGPKAPVLEAFFRHLERMGKARLLDIESGLKRITVQEFAEKSATVTSDALLVLDPIAIAVMRAVVNQFNDGNWSVVFERALTNAAYEIVLAEWQFGHSFFQRQFQFVALTEVVNA